MDLRGGNWGSPPPHLRKLLKNLFVSSFFLAGGAGRFEQASIYIYKKVGAFFLRVKIFNKSRPPPPKIFL